MNRRQLLIFFSASMGSGLLSQCRSRSDLPNLSIAKLAFTPVMGPMPLLSDTIPSSQQSQKFQAFTVADDLVLPQGYRYQVIAAWGDRVGDSRFGYNNDYLALLETTPNQGYLAINFEYISAIPWLQSYNAVIKQKLPFSEVQTAIKGAGKEGIDAFTLANNAPLKQQIRQICQEALIDQGMGVISLRKTTQGNWERTPSPADRRITGISGLTDQRYLRCTGPAQQNFRKTQGQGYLDGLGDRIIGTFGNCAGGITPWGTVLSGEENFQNQVAEAVYADGTPFSPSTKRFFIDEEELYGQGNVFGLAGHKYGWVVELDPANPKDYGTKHTWLGRYRHEAVGVRVEAGRPLAFYSGCDRRGGHVYKFVSRDAITNPQDKQNSKLLAEGMLYVAKFKPDGTGQWLALNPNATINPDSPNQIEGNTLLLPNRPDGGFIAVKTEAEVNAFRQRFKTLADLYTGSPEEQQGAILIDAHYAANAIGATCTARPEDTDIAPDGSLYIAFTSGSSGSEGGADARIFKGPKGEVPYEFGFIMHLSEDRNDPAAMDFQWKMLALGGEPVDGGMGFANPDNLLFDRAGNLWMVNDMSSRKINAAVPQRTEGNEPVSQSDLRGLYGNNTIWCIPTRGDQAGQAFLFGMGPMECETTGPFFSQDQKTLFLAIQHPGEVNGIRKDNATETRQFLMKTTEGQTFPQTRQVPIGSNWPDKTANAPPRPAVVAIVREDQGTIA
jgi:secreted PhoX family phosphatase